MQPIDQPLTFKGHPDQAEPETPLESAAMSIVRWGDVVDSLLLDFPRVKVEGKGE